MDVTRELWVKVLEYPLVQYIPLNRRNLIKINAGLPMSLRGKPNIRLITNKADLITSYFPASIDKSEIINQVDFHEKLLIMALNYDVEGLMYRTITISAVGKPTTGMYYLFNVDRHFFYRRKVFFQCFDMGGKEIPMPHTVFKVPLVSKRLKFDHS
ncbi:hypothetical protein MFMK1_002180 [Metallumcola ferriviriculae]|uniref:Uncharacterized protein n=1 Tax=Metallumcola ferriviriculae TaxID=3039180 RepID=A0AAU0UQ47_9FIRM|nr:hypothetical protein MFMK1_002180 [Desulfitibacteraceae bacterium MK1]